MEDLSKTINKSLWVLISSSFEEEIRKFLMSKLKSEEIVNKIVVRGRFEKNIPEIFFSKKECISEQLLFSIGYVLESGKILSSNSNHLKEKGLIFLVELAKRFESELTTFRPPRRSLIGFYTNKDKMNLSIALERDKNTKIRAVKIFFVEDAHECNAPLGMFISLLSSIFLLLCCVYCYFLFDFTSTSPHPSKSRFDRKESSTQEE